MGGMFPYAAQYQLELVLITENHHEIESIDGHYRPHGPRSCSERPLLRPYQGGNRHERRPRPGALLHARPAGSGPAAKAAGVLVFGRVTKGGAGVAGEFGEGVLRINGKTVDYYSVGSASVGLTLGVGKHSEVILFMTHDALDKFTASSNWSAGADGSIALVSKGAGGQYDVATLGKPILGFIFHEKGLLGDL